MAGSPYADLGSEAFWKSAVAETGPFEIDGLWQPRFPIAKSHRVVTCGSCFAQHFSRALKSRRYSWFNAEPAPLLLRSDDARDLGYGVFSFRTGNIYTARMLRQWLQAAFDARRYDEEVWEQEGRFYDPLRPAIEPGGFASPAELWAARAATCAAVRDAVRRADVLVFTMGLTECWRSRESGLEYAVCPGTQAGVYDPEAHVFVNQRFGSILRDMRRALAMLRRENPALSVLLTVSPVPLTATASGQHVLTATSASKSTLRAVARELAEDFDFVDYFPSYEIITHPVFRGMFFAPNLRSVVPEGVDLVMRHFFTAQHRAFPVEHETAPRARAVNKAGSGDFENDLRCEEEMLDAFAR